MQFVFAQHTDIIKCVYFILKLLYQFIDFVASLVYHPGLPNDSLVKQERWDESFTSMKNVCNHTKLVRAP